MIDPAVWIVISFVFGCAVGGAVVGWVANEHMAEQREQLDAWEAAWWRLMSSGLQPPPHKGDRK